MKFDQTGQLSFDNLWSKIPEYTKLWNVVDLTCKSEDALRQHPTWLDEEFNYNNFRCCCSASWKNSHATSSEEDHHQVCRTTISEVGFDFFSYEKHMLMMSRSKRQENERKWKENFIVKKIRKLKSEQRRRKQLLVEDELKT